MNREDIVSKIFSILKAENTIKQVKRDPIIPTELAKTAFPAVYIETSNETIEDVTAFMRESLMEVNIVLHVSGKNRDTVRNNVTATIESILMADRTLGGNAQNITLARIETITIGEASPFASVKLIFDVQYCYTL